MSKRTDTHRPGAIVPTEYRIECFYARASMMDGWPLPPVGIDRVIEVQRAQQVAGGAMFGSIGKCGVCGAHYNEGQLMRHEPSGDLVHFGRDCARKYEVLADLAMEEAFDAERAQGRAATARQIEKKVRADERAEFLAQHPGLETDLAVDHHIIRDIAMQLEQRRGLSDKQVALVQKIANEIRNPAAAEQHVPAPLGKGLEFEGEITSVKIQVSEQYGATWRMVVKVVTDAGSWLAWGTVPKALIPDTRGHRDDGDRESAVARALRGRRVKVKATLQAGRDPHFAIMKNPRGSLLPVEREMV